MDPLFKKVSLLLHCDGSNGSTTFTDSSSFGGAVTAVGATISTAQNKFGGASGVFDGADDYLQIADADRFDVRSGALTAEAWVYPTDLSAGRAIFFKASATPETFEWGVYLESPTLLTVYWGLRGSTQRSIRLVLNSAVPTNAWSHIAVTRDASGVWRGFLDGAMAANFQSSPVSSSQSFGPVTPGLLSDATDLGSTSAPVTIGALVISGTAFLPFAGYIDDLRLTFGVCRYVTDFFAPTAAFPDSYAPPPGVLLAPLSQPGASLSVSARTAESSVRLKDVYFGGRGQIVGTVKEDLTPTDLPLRRRVQLYAERGGVMVGETWSNASNGAYAFTNIDHTIKYFVVAFDYEQNYRAVIADNLTPELMP